MYNGNVVYNVFTTTKVWNYVKYTFKDMLMEDGKHKAIKCYLNALLRIKWSENPETPECKAVTIANTPRSPLF